MANIVPASSGMLDTWNDSDPLYEGTDGEPVAVRLSNTNATTSQIEADAKFQPAELKPSRNFSIMRVGRCASLLALGLSRWWVA
jgi:hypothetical protein